MTDEKRGKDLGVYGEWATGFSEASLDRALRDQQILRRGQLRDGDEYARYAPNQPSPSASTVIRATRDDLEFREWNEETGFSGVDRWPDAPGVQSPGQKRRRQRRDQIDEGF